ncbi:phage terminase large subunit [Desulfovulcanus sp.]
MKLNKRLLNEEFELLRQKLRQLEQLSDKGREERITRAKDDFRFFALTYFPHLLTSKPSKFHEWLFKHLPDLQRDEIAAPRANAKTTITRIYILWRICRGDTRFVAYISDAIDIAQGSLEAIKIELEENPRLAKDFPEACGMGRKWQAEEIITRNRIKIKVYGSGKRIRGANYIGHRPDLIVLDDLENDENVRTKEQRDKLQKWFESSILHLGPPDGSAQYLYIGTILHYDCLMLRVKKRGDFRYHKFKSLIKYPERMDLWEKWERIWKEDNRAGEKFYEAYKEEMDKGAEVLWPEMEPLYSLMCERAASRTAFSSEKQNDPLDEELAVFKKLAFYKELPHKMLYFGALDPALGKTRGDYTAIIVVARCQQTGKIYVVEADIGKYPPNKTIEKIIYLQNKYHCLRWAIESQLFQEFFRQILVEKSTKARVPVPAIPLTNNMAKEIRIESLGPHVENSVILFNPAHTTLIDQLTFYPLADHDDGPDALEMAFRIAYRPCPMEFRSRKSRKWNKRRGY